MRSQSVTRSRPGASAPLLAKQGLKGLLYKSIPANFSEFPAPRCDFFSVSAGLIIHTPGSLEEFASAEDAERRQPPIEHREADRPQPLQGKRSQLLGMMVARWIPFMQGRPPKALSSIRKSRKVIVIGPFEVCASRLSGKQRPGPTTVHVQCSTKYCTVFLAELELCWSQERGRSRHPSIHY